MAENLAEQDLHRIVMTAVIYNEEGKYLAIKRAPDKKVFPGKWTVPGGGLELSDYENRPKTTPTAWYYVVEDALRREIREEVNLEIEKPELLLDLVFLRPDGVPVLTLSYFAKFKSGDVVLEEGDSTEYRWVTVEEAKELDFIDGIPEEIEQVSKILRGATLERIHFNEN